MEGLISNSFKYKLSIKKLSIVEEELKLILVGKLTMLLMYCSQGCFCYAQNSVKSTCLFVHKHVFKAVLYLLLLIFFVYSCVLPCDLNILSYSNSEC